jgi:hypothetical protein
MAHDCPRDGTPAFGCSACYGHIKKAALNGGRDRLTEDELAFIGVTKSSRTATRPDGWRQPNTAMFEIEAVLSPEDSGMLQALMNAGSVDPVEFLA